MLAVASKLMEAIQWIFCFFGISFPSGEFSYFRISISRGNQRPDKKPPKGKLTRLWVFSSSFNMAAAWHSSQPVSPAASPVNTASQESSSHRNERGRQRKIRRERGDGEEEGGKLEGGKEETKLQWGREVMGILTALIWPVYSLLCSWW